MAPQYGPFLYVGIGLAVVTAVLTLVLVVRQGRDRAAWLSALSRWATLGVLTAALLGLSVRQQGLTSPPVRVLVFLDVSRSMAAPTPDGRPRMQAAVKALASLMSPKGPLGRPGIRVQVHLCARECKGPVPAQEILSSPPRANGTDTRLLREIDRVLASEDMEDIGAVLVLTDGMDHGGASIERRGLIRLEHYPLPVTVMAVPATFPKDDIYVDCMGSLEFLPVRDSTRVECLAGNASNTSASLRVQAWLDRKALLDRKIRVSAKSGAEISVDLFVRQPGLHVFRIRAARTRGDSFADDDTYATVFRAATESTRVLHLASAASWDVRFMREYLTGRPDFKVAAFHVLRSPWEDVWEPTEDTTLIPFPEREVLDERLDTFDLVVMQNFELPDMEREGYERALTGFVRGGGSLLIIGGDANLGGQGEWPRYLMELSPVESPGRSEMGVLEGHFPLEIPKEAQVPVFMRGNLTGAMASLPPLPAVVRLGAARKGSHVLAKARFKGKSFPLVAVWAVDKGAVGVVGSDATWRWAFDPRHRQTYFRLYDALVDYLTDACQRRRTVAKVDRRLAGPDEDVTITVEGATEAAQVHVTKLMWDGTVEPLEPLRLHTNRQGFARTRFRPPSAGVYEVAIGPDTGETDQCRDYVVVGGGLREVRDLASDEGRLQRLAQALGASLVKLHDGAPSTIAFRQPPRVASSRVVRVEVWRRPEVLLAVCLFLAVGWTMELGGRLKFWKRK